MWYVSCSSPAVCLPPFISFGKKAEQREQRCLTSPPAQLHLCFSPRALIAPTPLRRTQVSKFCSNVKKSEWYLLKLHVRCVSKWFWLYKLSYSNLRLFIWELPLPQTAGKVLQTHCKGQQLQSCSACSRERACLCRFVASTMCGRQQWGL